MHTKCLPGPIDQQPRGSEASKNKTALKGRAGHSLLFTLFANRSSATSMYHFAIATPLLF
jgi:hypothetical protein